MSSRKIQELTAKFKQLKTAYDEADEKLKEINAAWNACDEELLAAMVEEGVNSASFAGIGTISMRVKNYLSVNAANKSGFYDHLREIKKDDILKLDVNPKTLGSFLDGYLADLKAKYMEEDGELDQISARDKALEFLKSKGVSYFTKRDLALSKE